MISDSRDLMESENSATGSPRSRIRAAMPTTLAVSSSEMSSSATGRRKSKSRASMCCSTCITLRTMQAIRR